jgi:tellurite resistance protein TehA-like permease
MKKIICLMLGLVFLMGCSTIETVTVKKLNPDGTVASETTTVTKGPSIAKKSYNIINQTTAVKIKTTPDSATASTSWIEFIFGTSVSVIQMVAPIKDGESTPASWSRTTQTSIWADMFGTNVSSGTECYTAASGETADETAKRLKAFRSAELSDSTITNSPVSN